MEKKVRNFILISLLLAAILFCVLPSNYAGGTSDKWPALGFELVKMLFQLVIAGIVGKLLVDRYNESLEKEKASNQFRKNLLDGLIKAYHKTKRVRRILRGNTISDKGTEKINHKVYEEQMHDIIDAQLALENYKLQLDSFPKNFKTNLHSLKDEAKKLDQYLSNIISKYEKSGGVDEFIFLDKLTTLKDFLEKETFIEGFASYFHSSTQLIGEEIF